jgi:hypothetical protein
MNLLPKESLKSIKVGSTTEVPFDMDRCYEDRDYYLDNFAKCTGIEGSVSSTGWIDNTLEDLILLLTNLFITPAWEGLFNGAGQGFNHLVNNVLGPTFSYAFNLVKNTGSTSIEIFKHILTGVATGSSSGLQNTIGPFMNALFGGATSGTGTFYATLQNVVGNLQPTFENAVNEIIDQLSTLPNLGRNIAQVALNYIPETITNVATKIATSLKSDYRNSASCETLKYLWFDNPIVPYVYGAFPELGSTALSTFRGICYSTYTEGFFQNFTYPIATWGIPGSQEQTSLPTVRIVDYPSPQQFIDTISQGAFFKVMSDILSGKYTTELTNSISYSVNTSSRPDRLDEDDDIDMKLVNLKKSPEGKFLEEINNSMTEVASRVRKNFRKCKDDECCTIEEILAGVC